MIAHWLCVRCLNRQIQIIDAVGFSTYPGYHGVGQIFTRDRRELDTITSFDDLSRPVVVTYALDQILLLTYDKIGNVIVSSYPHRVRRQWS